MYIIGIKIFGGNYNAATIISDVKKPTKIDSVGTFDIVSCEEIKADLLTNAKHLFNTIGFKKPFILLYHEISNIPTGQS